MYYIVKKIEKFNGILEHIDVGYVSSQIEADIINDNALEYNQWLIDNPNVDEINFFDTGQIVYVSNEIRATNGIGLPLVSI